MSGDKYLWILLLVIFLYAFNYAAASSSVVTENFESGRIGNIWTEEFGDNGYAAQIVSSTARQGVRSLRIELRQNDHDVSGSRRAEIALGNEKPLEEHWYSFSIYLPSGGDEDYAIDHSSSEIIVQWHNEPDRGEEWTSPPLALSTANGRYVLSRRWDDAPMTSNDQMDRKGNVDLCDLGSYQGDKGKWVDWVFHIRWGWLKSQMPILEVYKNNRKIADFNGLPNTTNDKDGVYLKLGIFKWDWKENPQFSEINSRVIYFDAISVDDPRLLVRLHKFRDLPPFLDLRVFKGETLGNNPARKTADRKKNEINLHRVKQYSNRHALGIATLK